MRTIRFSWPAEAGGDLLAEVFLASGQARHGALVLRLAPGAPVEMVGPLGLAEAVVTTVGAGHPPRLGVKLTGPWRGDDVSGGSMARGLGRVTLAVALIQPGRFDWAVEKAVELGAGSLIPLICARTKPGLGRPSPSRESRWDRLAEEARKQCGRHQPLTIPPPATLNDLLTKWEGPIIFLHPAGPPKLPTSIFTLDAAELSGSSCPGGFTQPENSSEKPSENLSQCLPQEGQAPLVLVGPEGGFTAEEQQAIVKVGGHPWSLGGGILRTETAALAALVRLGEYYA